MSRPDLQFAAAEVSVRVRFRQIRLRPPLRRFRGVWRSAWLLWLPAAALAPASLLPAMATPTSTSTPAAAEASAPGGLRLVLDRQARLLRLLEGGVERRRFPVAVGMPGWETPVGEFRVMTMTRYPVWEHPETGARHAAGPANPLGSRWIGFHRDCRGRKGWDGEQMLDVRGCVDAGFHGTPHRWTVGRAVSHGCVRLYDEHVRELFELVAVGTPVTVLP